MSDWYWMKNGEKHGPVHTAGLKELARTGQLLPTDMIWCERLRNWVPASQTKGLEFGASGSTHADRSSEAVSTTSTRTPVAQRQATPRGPIKYRCARCGRLLESQGSLAGREDTCPACGKAMTVPLQSTTGARAFLRKMPKAVHIGTAAALLVAITSLAAWLALRDTWERDHGAELRQMSEQTISLIRAARNEDGVTRYEAMLALVGNRQLEDPRLRQVVGNAGRAAESARRQLSEAFRQSEQSRREAENLAKLHALESEANAFIGSGDLESGIGKYDLVLALVRSESTSQPAFADAILRIIAQRNAAYAALQARKAERERLERERAMREAKLAEERRIEEQNRAKGLVKLGGEWLSKEQALAGTFELGVKALVESGQRPTFKHAVLNVAYNVEKSNSLTFPHQAALTFTQQLKSLPGNPYSFMEFLVKCGFDGERWHVSSMLVKDWDGVWRDYHSPWYRYPDGRYGTDEVAELVRKALSNRRVDAEVPP